MHDFSLRQGSEGERGVSQGHAERAREREKAPAEGPQHAAGNRQRSKDRV